MRHKRVAYTFRVRYNILDQKTYQDSSVYATTETLYFRTVKDTTERRNVSLITITSHRRASWFEKGGAPMKKQIVRKLSRREVTDVYVCEYDTPLFQAFLAYAEAFILYIIAMILGSGASSSDTNNHYCVRINGIMYPLAARNVSIAVGCYVIQVRIMAPIAITNSAVLYALALYNLANSPDLLQLPRWMVRKIRRKARRVHFISSTFSCADLASMPINEIAFLKKTSYQKLFMNFKVEIVSVKRTLLHGCVGVERYASYLTASDIPNLSAMLSPYIPLLNNLPERRLYFISHFQQIGCNRTAMFLTIGYICLEKKKPGFLNSSAADVLCAVFYLLRMLLHVVCNALVQVFYVLKDTWQIANYIETEASPSTKSLPEPKAEASSSVDSTESVQSHHDIKAPKTCTCAACKRIMPVTVKPALKQTLTASAIDSAVNIEAKEVAATVSSEKKSQDPGKLSKEGSSYEHTAESGETALVLMALKTQSLCEILKLLTVFSGLPVLLFTMDMSRIL